MTFKLTFFVHRFPSTVARSPFQVPCSLSFSFGCEGLCRGSFSSPQVDSCSGQLCSPRQNIAASPAMQTGDKWVKNSDQVLSCPVPSLMPSTDILFPDDNYIFPFFSCPIPSFLLVAFEFQLLIIALHFIICTYFHWTLYLQPRPQINFQNLIASWADSWHFCPQENFLKNI